MKSKSIITSALLAGMAVAGAVTYADTQTTTGATDTNNAPRMEAKIFGFGMGQEGKREGMGFEGKRGLGGQLTKLTDAEQTALKTMTDDQKKAFFDQKRADAEAKMEAKEAVIDKLVNGESLTDAEKVTLAEIKTERTEAKAKRAEMKTKQEAMKKTMDELKPIFEKIKNKQTLTDAEQQKLYEAQSSMGDHGRGEPEAEQTPVSTVQ